MYVTYVRGATEEEEHALGEDTIMGPFHVLRNIPTIFPLLEAACIEGFQSENGIKNY